MTRATKNALLLSLEKGSSNFFSVLYICIYVAYYLLCSSIVSIFVFNKKCAKGGRILRTGNGQGISSNSI